MNGERGAVEMTAGGAPGTPWRDRMGCGWKRHSQVEDGGEKGVMSALGFDQQPGLSSPKY